MARIIEPNVELEAILARSTPAFERAMLRLSAWIGRTIANGQNVYVSTIRRNPDFQTIERVLYQTNLLCDLLGRRRTLLWRDKALADEKAVKLGAANPGTVIAPEVPPVVFEEAVNAITTRNPEIAVGYEAVQRIYQRKGFGLAISTSEKLTQRVQDELSKGLKEGRTYAETAAEMERIAAEEEAITGSPVTTKEWTKAYSETVYRTNAASSYEAGKWEQVLDPDVSGVIVAMEYETMEDSDVRPEHAKLHGLVAGVNDPVWATHSPPLSYNCRCGLRYITRAEAKERGLMIEGADQVSKRIEPEGFTGEAPNPEFRTQRPDQTLEE